MSTVPYIFASQVGNIALSELDVNFANVKANVDYATQAGTVTTPSQPAITGVGTLTTLSVTGNITSGAFLFGNGYYLSGIGSSYANANVAAYLPTYTGDIGANNVNASGNLTTTGNGYVSYMSVTNAIRSNYFNGNVVSVAGNINGNNVVVGNTVSVGGNITGGNILTAGQVQNTGLSVVGVNYANVTANATTVSLSTTVSRNILIANNTGYTTTINMPATPVDGQISTFTISGNAMTLVAGTGTLSFSFAGSAAAGTVYTYVYRNSNTTWYRTN